MKNLNDIDPSCCRLDFKPVTENDIPLLNKYFTSFPSRSCDFSIGGTLMWTEYYEYEFAEFNGTLFLRGKDPESGETIYYSPLGLLPLETSKRLIIKDAANFPKSRMLIPIESEANAGTDSENNYDEKLKEYLYPIERFLHFAGKKMEKKRNHLNYFLHNYDNAVIENISPANIGELIRFTYRFSSAHEATGLSMYENLQTIKVLEDFESYPFEGIAIRLNGEIIGYTFGEKIGDVFFAHVEKGNIEFRGVYQALASFMSLEVNKKYPDVKYLNREEDMGDESLRQSKESYHPTLIVNKSVECLTLCTASTVAMRV